MKKYVLIFIAFWAFDCRVMAQMRLNDQAIIYQQERMVYKQWDRDKFIPKWRWWRPSTWAPYAATWLLQPSYKKGPDLRPLKPGGEQTQRLALAVAMQTSSNYYKKEADTLRNTAIAEYANYAGVVSSADPLYQLYYKKELAPLSNITGEALKNVPSDVAIYIAESGYYEWYITEMNSLAERFKNARTADLDRGQRVLMYHRIMLEQRELAKNWKQRLAMAQQMLAYRDMLKKQKNNARNYFDPTTKSEDDVLNELLRNRKTMK